MSNLIKLRIYLFVVVSCVFSAYAAQENQELDKNTEKQTKIVYKTSCEHTNKNIGRVDLLEEILDEKDERRNYESFEQQRLKVKTVRVLEIDGGATRGAIPAKVLKEIELLTKQPISKLFHIVGGTSIGCLLTAGTTIPEENNPSEPRWSVENLIDALYSGGPSVFRTRIPWGSIYDVSALERMADQYCGKATFDQSIIPTVAIAFDCLAAKTKVICSWEKEEVFLTRDVILASSAVPFVFYPRTIKPVNFNAQNNKYILADGFLGANNPTTIIISEARKLYPNVERFEIVSLGNGVINDPLYYRLLKEPIFLGKLLMNAFLRVFDIGLNTVSSDEYIKGIIIGNYTRINPIVSLGGSPFDASKENLDAFQKDAEDYIKINQKEFDDLIERLSKPKD